MPADHPVYPGGPPCQSNCPGEHSQYHDGYSDGFEAGENRARAEVLAEVEGLPLFVGADAGATMRMSEVERIKNYRERVRALLAVAPTAGDET